MRSWRNDSARSGGKLGVFDGQRCIVLHASNDNGFIENATIFF